MTKYTRLTGKVFGSSATATGDDPEIGQFGSALAGTYNGTTDVSIIQSLPAWQKGFISAVTPSTQFPPLPEMTGFGKVLSQQICYLLQQGIAEWDSGTTYYENNWCAYNGKLYISKSDENLNNLPTNVTYWTQFTGGFSRNFGEIVTSSLPIIDDNTLHLADGSLLSATDYPEFVSYVANLYNSLPSGDFSPATQNSTLGNDSWSSIAYGNGLYIAVSLNNNYATSSDGTNWNTPIAFSSEVSNARAICFDGTQFVLLDYSGNIFTTTNGTSWTKVTRIDQYFTDGKDIAYGNGVYIVITTGGEVWKSTNLSYWNLIGADYTGTGTTVEFVNDLFVIVFKSQFVYTVYWNSNGTQILTNWNKTVGSNNNIINNYCCILYENEYKLINEYGYVYTTNNLSSGFSSGVQDTNLGSNTWTSYASNSSDDITMISSTGYISQKQSPITYVFATEADWQATYTTYGECGKYVYNSSANTVRIPLYNTYLTNTVNPQKLGNLTEASIPNIKGVISANERLYKSGTSVSDYGAFNNYAQNVVSGQSDNTNFDNDLWNFDASRVSSVYSDSATTVNTQSIKQLVYIVVAK